MSRIRQFMESGTSHARSASERRNVVLTNAIAVVGSFAILLLILLRIVAGGTFDSTTVYLFPATLIFLTPILLNHFGYTLASRLAFCWLTTAYIAIVAIAQNALGDGTISSQIGVRLYFLALCCPPFLMFDIPREKGFWLALAPPVAGLLAFDPFMNMLGYALDYSLYPDYWFNNVRA